MLSAVVGLDREVTMTLFDLFCWYLIGAVISVIVSLSFYEGCTKRAAGLLMLAMLLAVLALVSLFLEVMRR